MKIKQILAISGLAFSSSLIPVDPALSQCAISVSSVNFGAYDIFSNIPKDITGSITYNCTGVNPTPTSVAIDLSQGNASNYNQRQLRNGTDSINYNLYLDAAGQIIWGNASSGTSRYTSSVLNGNVTIYGRIPARQKVTAGTYSDTITVTIEF
jgi:spore coat protein U-like protein